MDRRSFFRSAIKKGGDSVGKAVVKAADAKVKKQASRWIRPPFAIHELEFLLACSRCTDCIEACPHQVIFGLSPRVGIKAAGTPAMDLLNKGCHLCADWPCVMACDTGALKRPEEETEKPEADENNSEAENGLAEPDKQKPVLPKLAIASIDENTCLPFSGPECGACLHSCPVDGALGLDRATPVIDQLLCTGCGLCRESCITEPKAITIRSAG